MSDNLDHPLHCPRNRPNDISSDMEFSISLSRSLDILGYKQDMIRLRVDFWKLMKSLQNIHDVVDSETIYAGSRPEGVVAVGESDVDIMIVNHTVICADNPQYFMHHKNLTLFETNKCDTEPGYTKLKVIKLGKFDADIADSLFMSNYNTTYISSEFFINTIMMKTDEDRKYTTPRNVALKKSGPAFPLYNPQRPDIVNDLVFSFKCFCPALLRSWLRRPRQYNWPPPNILYEISQMEAHVVPDGCKGSDTYYQEWRICFTKAEICLIHSLNNFQMKLCVVLKMIAKTFLKNICPEITSYIVKNIVFWMCELLPIEYFTDHLLMNRIFQALEFLRKCVLRNYLSNYMIPERNLFHCRIEVMQKRELIDSLSSFIHEGPAALFHILGKICGAMSVLYQEPQTAEFYMIKRNIIEKLALLKNLRRRLIVPPNMTLEVSKQFLFQDEICVHIMTAQKNIILPEWREIRNAHEIVQERMKTILS